VLRYRRLILDAGPLVAAISERDRYHRWAVERLAETAPPLMTCEAVLGEACHLLRGVHGGPDAVLGFLTSGAAEIRLRLDSESERIRQLMARYADVPMSLADACLVRLAEIEAGSTVLSLDTHFRIYRMHGRQVIPVLMP
jgi:predicted nucleic acid-binding protein